VNYVQLHTLITVSTLLVAAQAAGCMAADPSEAPSQSEQAELQAAEANSSPGLSAEQVRAGVRSHFHDFRVCYESLLAKNPKAAGRISLEFTIRPEGTIDGLKLRPEDDLGDAPFLACMTSAAATFSFPSATEQTTVKYPIVMTPGD